MKTGVRFAGQSLAHIQLVTQSVVRWVPVQFLAKVAKNGADVKIHFYHKISKGESALSESET